MEKNEQIIYLLRETIDDANNLIAYGDPDRQKNIIDQWSAVFDDGYVADIKLCGGDPPYVDAVLFHSGFEVCVLECDAETIDGEYTFWTQYAEGEEDREYTVYVKEGTRFSVKNPYGSTEVTAGTQDEADEIVRKLKEEKH